MLLLRGYEQWSVISLLSDHLSALARGRKLFVIFLLYVVSAYVVQCCLVLVFGRQYLLAVVYIMCVYSPLGY